MPARAELNAELSVGLKADGDIGRDRVGSRAIKEDAREFDAPGPSADVEEEDGMIAELIAVLDLAVELDAEALLIGALAAPAFEPDGAIFGSPRRDELFLSCSLSCSLFCPPPALQLDDPKKTRDAERLGELLIDEAAFDARAPCFELNGRDPAAGKDWRGGTVDAELFRIEPRIAREGDGAALQRLDLEGEAALAVI